MRRSPTCARGQTVLVVSASEAPPDVVEAIGAGARGYLSKQAEEAEIVGAIRAVAEGRTYVSATLAAYLLQAPIRPAGRPYPLRPPTGIRAPLSEPERGVVRPRPGWAVLRFGTGSAYATMQVAGRAHLAAIGGAATAGLDRAINAPTPRRPSGPH
jgi:hypothetical protein